MRGEEGNVTRQAEIYNCKAALPSLATGRYTWSSREEHGVSNLASVSPLSQPFGNDGVHHSARSIVWAGRADRLAETTHHTNTDTG